MPPIELWGPATWTLFHVLAEKVNEHMYPRIAGQLFDVIKRICSALPCPECAQDATIFLAKIKVHELKTKVDFKNMIYMFHNYVNSKKRKPLFKYINLEVYKRYNIVSVFNRFISFYHTKGNMRLLSESFQRQLIVKNVREWFSKNICFFISRPVPSEPSFDPVPSEPLEPLVPSEPLEPLVPLEPLEPLEPLVPLVDPDLNETKEVSNIDNETPFLSPSDVLSVPEVEEEEVLREATVPAVEATVSEVKEQVVLSEVEEEVEATVPAVEATVPAVEATVPAVEVEEAQVEEEVEAVETKPKRGRKKKTV